MRSMQLGSALRERFKIMTRPVNEWYTGGVDELEERFHRLLAGLAGLCKYELDVTIVELYDRAVSQYGYAVACQALEALISERGPSEPFPSIGAIRARMGVQITPKSLAMETVDKVAAAISSKGYTWRDRFKTTEEFEQDMLRVIGPAGVAVVKRLGGWRATIEFANSNTQHYRSWIRESVASIIETNPKLLETSAKLLELRPPAPELTHKKS